VFRKCRPMRRCRGSAFAASSGRREQQAGVRPDYG
jgi:hypothetical protein